MLFFFFLIYLFIYIYFLLCWVFVSVWGLSLVATSGGHSSSRCTGLSLSPPLPLLSTGSRRAGSVVVAHGLSCSAACGIFPDQGSNPCLLHWQADSQPLRHQGSPICWIFGKDFNYLFHFWFLFLSSHGLRFTRVCRRNSPSTSVAQAPCSPPQRQPLLSWVFSRKNKKQLCISKQMLICNAPPPFFFSTNIANSIHCAGPHCFSLTMLYVILERIIYQHIKNFPTLYFSCGQNYCNLWDRR